MSAVRAAQTRPSGISVERHAGSSQRKRRSASENDVKTTNLAFSWHILDFGLSYIRARQAADQILISNERRRKVINQIIEDVRAAYWRTVAEERTMGQLHRLNGRITRALNNSQELDRRAQASPLTALTYERELREIQREIRNLQSNLITAKSQLAALINVDPGSNFSVRVLNWYKTPSLLGMSAEEMTGEALVSRSELRVVAYKERINHNESHAAILEMLPGITADALPNFDSNKFLFNNYWVSWGARVIWNLIKVFSYPARRAQVEATDDLLDARALAVAMAIVT